MSNTSGVSAAARSMCQGYCGSRDVTYYSVEAVSPDDDDDDDDEPTDTPPAPVVIELVEEPVAVSGLPELLEFRRESRRMFRQQAAADHRTRRQGRQERRQGRFQWRE
ncbi:uncharacterized protein LOC112557415 [Pomacea canaliculata]|uniref:uncharacterized protein LOC112557415 n=1 Tax=Pomacea canaliculata TaxID=400727 RepID=UPI000D72A42E|nr:uncharacterized protein LOC112557415 [Pomacea canaliculata]